VMCGKYSLNVAANRLYVTRPAAATAANTAPAASSTRTATEGGTFYLEFRTGKDAGKQHVFGEHFRLYLDGQQVVDELEGLGAEILHHEEGHGLAVYQEEDPHVARLAVRWS